MILYSIRRGPHGYQLGKFDDDFNVAAVYDVDLKHCTCPAGHRPSCKHRKMLPRMLAKVDTNQFYCYETQTWHQPLGDLVATGGQGELTIESFKNLPDDANVAEEFSKLLAGEARLVEDNETPLASEASELPILQYDAETNMVKPITGPELVAAAQASPSPSGIRRR